MLEQKHIPHEVFEFDDAIRSAQEVARVTGMPAGQVLKTLVIEADPPKGKPFLVMMPSAFERKSFGWPRTGMPNATQA